MNERENKLKCREKEVVQMETLIQAAMCCELLDKLGEKLCADDAYIHRVIWEYGKNTVYHINDRAFANVEYFEKKKKIITATEWLNRHGVFVPGQDVYVSDSSAKKLKSDTTRTFIHGQVTVCGGGEVSYREGGKFNTAMWNYIVSPYPEWKDEPELIKVCVKGQEFHVPADKMQAIEDIINE